MVPKIYGTNVQRYQWSMVLIIFCTNVQWYQNKWYQNLMVPNPVISAYGNKNTDTIIYKFQNKSTSKKQKSIK